MKTAFWTKRVSASQGGCNKCHRHGALEQQNLIVSVLGPRCLRPGASGGSWDGPPREHGGSRVPWRVATWWQPHPPCDHPLLGNMGTGTALLGK